MTIYYVLVAFLMTGALCLHYTTKPEKAKKRFCIFAFFLFFGMMALRHPQMGIDLRYGSSFGYLGMFQTIGASSWETVFQSKFQNYERGYIIFCKLISFFGDNEQVLLIFCAFIAVSTMCWLIYKYSDSCLLSVIIWMGLPIFEVNYSALRQSIAIAITLISYRFIREKKLLFFIVTILLASTFHTSAYLFLVAYPLYHLKLKQSYRVISFLILPVVYAMRYPLFNILSRLLKENAAVDNNSAITLFLVFTAIYIFCILYLDYDDADQSGLSNLFFLACFCQAFGGVNSIAIRVGYYFMPYLILLLPKLLHTMNVKINDGGKTAFAFYTVIFLCFGSFGLYSIYRTYWSMSYPYYFFWQTYLS